MPIVQLMYTNSPGFVTSSCIDVCIPGTPDPASVLYPCLFQRCNASQFFLKLIDAVTLTVTSF
jgi:hypothetical protein